MSTMETAQKRDLYFAYLAGEGYRPEVDRDGDVAFKYEGGNYYLSVDEDDTYFRLVYPNFWSIESPDELQRAYEAASRATEKIKVAKVYVRQDARNTSAAIEMFLDPLTDFRSVFPRSLQALRAGVGSFVEAMRGGA